MRQEFKPSIKIFAFVLSFLMLIASLPIYAYASLRNTEPTEHSEEREIKSEIVVLEEDKTLREENIKHFKLSDGTTKAVVYSQAVHYKDEDGKWIDIDNALTLNGSNYLSSNKSEIKLANKSGSNNLLSIKDGNYKIDFTPLNANKVGVAIQNPQSKSSRKFEDVSKLNSLVSKAVYADVYDGVDIEYILVGNNIKENIIVKEKQDSYAFSFELELGKLSAELVNGAIILSDYDSGEKIYEIPAPYMYDANNVYSSNVEYSLAQNGKWKYTFTVTANAEWINAESRAFPVTVDPSFGVSDDDIISVIVNENGQIQEQAFAYFIGNGLKAYIKLNTLPQFPRSAYIVSADVNMYYCYGNETSVYLKEILSAWNENSASNVVLSDNPIDYVKTKELWGGEDDNNPRYNWNITTLANLWYNGGTNYGFALEITEEEKQAYFANLDYGYESREPLISITYRDMKGAEPYWSFISQSAGNAGTGSINLATGNLLFEISTLTTTDSLFGFTPSIIYNSAIAGEQYEYPNAMIGYWGSYAAKGFKMNFHETLIRDSFVNANGDNETYYVWADSDGTEHYFIADENGVYRDEDGLQLTLTVDTENDVCTVTDSAHNERVFVWNLGAIEDKVEKTYYLSYIKDASGNKLKFLVDAQRKPQYVRVEPNGMSEINMLNMLYNSSSVIYAVWNTVTGDAILFRHSDTPNGDLSATGGEYLREVLYLKCDPSNTNWRSLQSFIGETDNETDGITTKAVMKYEYNSDGYLTSVHDTLSDYKIVYGYNYSGQVTSVTEYGKNDTQGQTIGINYGVGYTEARTSGANDIYGDSDDIINVYVFDNQGRAITIYSTNEARTEIYGVSTGAYDEEATNSIKSSFVTGGASPNYLLNGGFEGSDTALESWNTSGTVSLCKNGSVEWNDGKASLYALNSADSSLYQIVELSQGDYTLSLDINAFESSNLSVKVMVREVLENGYGETFVESLPMNEFYASGSDGFASLSFTVNTESYTTKKYEVGVYLEKNSAFDGSRYISVDNIMLSKSTGAQYCSILNDGSFELLRKNQENDNWIFEAGTIYGDILGPEIFDNGSLRISGEISSEGRARNNVYLATETAINAWKNSTNGTGVTGEPTVFIVSGYAQANNAMKSKNSVFALCAEVGVLYKVQNANGTITVYEDVIPYQFSFNSSTTDWQYTSGSFVIPENVMVKSIAVICEYSYNLGDAYFDNISLVCDKTGNVSQYEYYEDGKLKSQTTGTSTTFYTYDEDNGQISYLITPDNVIHYEYFGNTSSVETVYLYNDKYKYNSKKPEEALENISKLTRKTSTYYAYDSCGLATLIQIHDEQNDRYIISSNEYCYNSRIFGALKAKTDSFGNVTRYFYNETNGNLIAVTEPNGWGTYYRYDELGNVISVQQAMYNGGDAALAANGSDSVVFTYDEANQLNSITAGGTTYNFSYDVFGNGESITIGDTTLVKYTSNERNGKTEHLEYANGVKIYYTYDKLNRITEVKYTKENEEDIVYTYTYDSKGNIIKIEDSATDNETLYKYDSFGNLMGYCTYNVEADKTVISGEYFYDDQNRLSVASYYKDCLIGSSNGGYYNTNHSYTYSYNTDGNLKNIIVGFMSDEDTLVLDYNYDNLGRLNDKEISLDGNVKNTIKYFYRMASNELDTDMLIEKYQSEIAIGNNSVAQDLFEYEYDGNGNITKISVNGEEKCSYEYDSRNRLTRENNKPLRKTYRYSYDANGNITMVKEYAYTKGNVASLIPEETIEYIYSDGAWKDQLVSYDDKEIEYDAMGNPTKYLGYDFSWNSKGKLETITKRGEDIGAYTYNEDGIRTSKTVNGVKHEYCLEGSTVVFETYGKVFIMYLYDEAGTPVGMAYRDGSKANTSLSVEQQFEYYLFTKNAQGDIIGIYDKSGQHVVSYTYDAWGNHETVIEIAGYEYVSTANPFRYRGYYFDQETGYYYLNSRYYDCETRRFISLDDISYLGADGGLNSFNLYAYCGNNPVRGYDPNGTFDQSGGFEAFVMVALIMAATVGISQFFVSSKLSIVMIGAATALGGISSIIEQTRKVGADNIDISMVMLSTISSALTSAFMYVLPIKYAVLINALIGAAEGYLKADNSKTAIKSANQNFIKNGVFYFAGLAFGAVLGESVKAIVSEGLEFIFDVLFYIKENTE